MSPSEQHVKSIPCGKMTNVRGIKFVRSRFGFREDRVSKFVLIGQIAKLIVRQVDLKMVDSGLDRIK